MGKQKNILINLLRVTVIIFSVAVLYSAAKDYTYIDEKEKAGYYFSNRFENVLSNIMDTAENYHDMNVLTYNETMDRFELTPQYRASIQDELDAKVKEYSIAWEEELEDLKQRQLDSSLYPDQHLDIQTKIDDLEYKIANASAVVEAEKVAGVEKDLDYFAKTLEEIKNATIIYTNKSVNIKQYESMRDELKKKAKMLASSGEDYYWFEVGDGSYEIEEMLFTRLRKVKGRDGSANSDNIFIPNTINYRANQLMDKEGFRLFVFIGSSSNNLNEFDAISNGYRLFWDDLDRIGRNADRQVVAVAVAIALLVVQYFFSKRKMKKLEREGKTMGESKMDEAVQSFLHKLIYFVGNLKLEAKFIIFLIGIKSIDSIRYFDSSRTFLFDIIGVCLGLLVVVDFVGANKEAYLRNSFWHQWRASKRKRNFNGLAKNLGFSFDAIFVIGAVIIACYVLAAFSGDLHVALLAALFGGLIILFIIWKLYFKLLDERIGYIDEISASLDKMVRGESGVNVIVKEGNPFAPLAENINRLKEGYGTAMEEKMKSERMKTELITNVSHDLKTPLTSIINYIDLLKNEEVEPEYARDYITVLEQKAERLNVLIQDLFEVSKAASGDLALEMERLDVAQLLRQTLAEMDGKIEDSSLNFVTNIPKDSVMVYADGKKLHRVFDNLIINILKYSLEGTRVYIDVIQNGSVKIVMKNIANYEMNFDQSEIVQRFTRGDQARSSEGSGLGLAIAQSLVDLMGMKMTIRTDGDLFKVEIEIDKL